MILRRGGEKLRYCGGTPRPLLRRLAKRDAVVRRLAKRDAKPEAAHTRTGSRPSGRSRAARQAKLPRDPPKQSEERRRERSAPSARRRSERSEPRRERERAQGAATRAKRSEEGRVGAERRRSGSARARLRARRAATINKAAVRRYRSARRARSSPTEERWRGGMKKAKGKAAEGRQLIYLDITVIVFAKGGRKAGRSSRLLPPFATQLRQLCLIDGSEWLFSLPSSGGLQNSR